MDELHIWHIFVAVLIPTITILGGVYRLRVTDKDRIVTEARRQERFENRLEALEKRDKDHDALITKLFDKLDEIISRVNNMSVEMGKFGRSLEDHRRECEQRRRED